MEIVFPFFVAGDDLAGAVGIMVAADGGKKAAGIDGVRNILSELNDAKRT